MKRVNIFITEKYKALQKMEEGKSKKKSVAEEYGVKKNTISTWIAKRKIFEAYESSIRIRSGELESEKIEEK